MENANVRDKKIKLNQIIEYNGFHYVPVRSFSRKEKGMSLKKISAYLRYVPEMSMSYNYDDFYMASGNSEADVFRCIETGKNYIPCANSLQEYQFDIDG